jgi:hypothetical protein
MYRLYEEAAHTAANLEQIGSHLQPPASETCATLAAYLRDFARLPQARALVPVLVAEIDERLRRGDFDGDVPAAPCA